LPTVSITAPGTETALLENCTTSLKATVANISNKDQLVITNNGTVINPTTYTFINNIVTLPVNVSNRSTIVITATNTTGTVGGATVNIYRFSGTPTVSGTFSFIVSVNVGSTITQAVSIIVRPTGKRYPTGSSRTPLTTIKRYDASAGWVDVRIGKRYDGTNWVELGNTS
jgi:hypothetical protein